MGNRSIGTAAAGGMFIGTVFGLVLVPGLYILFAKLAQRFGSGQTPDDELKSTTLSTKTKTNGAVIHES
jgi:hypothetical protein